ncbi:hypothetical protein AB4Z32_16930 [Massilia sp. 2TAF26]|uniref:hypothetical protein n=1 Tax=Massilia sp. 2TAF26 TaxID=3233012 RepID=UPI003F996A36
MEDAVAVFEMLVSQHSDPLLRLRNLFIGTVDYWLKNPEHFDVLFAMPVKESVSDEAELFGQAPVVVRALNVYYDAIQVFFDSLPQYPMSPRLAADALLAAVYGLIAFPRMTQTMKWSSTAAMADIVVDAILKEWERLGKAG